MQIKTRFRRKLARQSLMSPLSHLNDQIDWLHLASLKMQEALR